MNKCFKDKENRFKLNIKLLKHKHKYKHKTNKSNHLPLVYAFMQQIKSFANEKSKKKCTGKILPFLWFYAFYMLRLFVFFFFISFLWALTCYVVCFQPISSFISFFTKPTYNKNITYIFICCSIFRMLSMIFFAALLFDMNGIHFFMIIIIIIIIYAFMWFLCFFCICKLFCL